MEQLFLQLLAPAARHLGQLWERDVCDFTQVTVGLMRLQEVLRAMSPSFEREMSHRERGRHILLTPTPGEKHTFGLFMVSEFLRNAGWSVFDEPKPSEPELTQLVSQRWFSLIGLSLSCETRIETLTDMIGKLRAASMNSHLGVLVGGPLFLSHPELVSRVGADCTAIDGRDAVQKAESLRAAQDPSEGERERVR
jgi:methanogenic corrinoid protein MtbC1